jgi:hypothetical protein
MNLRLLVDEPDAAAFTRAADGMEQSLPAMKPF